MDHFLALLVCTVVRGGHFPVRHVPRVTCARVQVVPLPAPPLSPQRSPAPSTSVLAFRER